MRNTLRTLLVCCAAGGLIATTAAALWQEGFAIRAGYSPLADYRAGIVTHERYPHEVQHAGCRIQRMNSCPVLRTYFRSGEVDIA